LRGVNYDSPNTATRLTQVYLCISTWRFFIFLGAAKNKMFIDTFPHEWQDFLSDNLTQLDTWVLNSISGMVANQTLPRGEEVVIFLSLLAIDTIGHAKKPGSK